MRRIAAPRLELASGSSAEKLFAPGPEQLCPFCVERIGPDAIGERVWRVVDGRYRDILQVLTADLIFVGHDSSPYRCGGRLRDLLELRWRQARLRPSFANSLE